MDLSDYAYSIHSNARAKGFWDVRFNLGERLMLIVSELAEALEADRQGEPAVHVPLHRPDCVPVESGTGCDAACKMEGAAVEIVDALIRCLDTLEGMRQAMEFSSTIDELVQAKMKFNSTRPLKHGKMY